MIRALLLAVATLILSACAGFQPMHATKGGFQAYDDVRIIMGDGKDEADRSVGFMIEQRLRDRIGNADPANPTYELSINPSVLNIPLGLSGLDRATRFDSRSSAGWVLRRAGSDTILARGGASSTTTYSADRDPYRLYATEIEARERAAREVADRLLLDLATQFAEMN